MEMAELFLLNVCLFTLIFRRHTFDLFSMTSICYPWMFQNSGEMGSIEDPEKTATTEK